MNQGSTNHPRLYCLLEPSGKPTTQSWDASGGRIPVMSLSWQYHICTSVILDILDMQMYDIHIYTYNYTYNTHNRRTHMKNKRTCISEPSNAQSLGLWSELATTLSCANWVGCGFSGARQLHFLLPPLQKKMKPLHFGEHLREDDPLFLTLTSFFHLVGEDDLLFSHVVLDAAPGD